MQKTAALQHHHEVEVFNTALRKLGYDEREFTLRYVQWPKTSKPATAVSDLVVVKRTNGIEKAYTGNEKTDWIVSFTDDLNLGFFGRGISE
jgi:hypothetical protein